MSELTSASKTQIALPPAAVLLSEDGQSRFSLAILGWETGAMPCTRYDEWIVCRLALSTPTMEELIEGPWMLRHEVADLKTAVEKCLLSDATAFHSDYMETVLKISLEPTVEMTTVSINFKNPEAQNPQSAQFFTNASCLASFSRGLALQLEDFYSVL